AVLNTHLLQQPLTALFADASGTLPMLTAAAFPLAVVGMSLLLSECPHVTRLLPLLDGLPRHSRSLFTSVVALITLALIGGESTLLASSHGEIAPGWVQPVAVWGLASAGAVVPLVLALLAPSLESLLATSRPVLMSFVVALLTL